MSQIPNTRPSNARPLYTAAELARVLDLDEAQCVDVWGVSLDSRALAPGDLFVALDGGDTRFHGALGSGRDGHDFVPAAAAAGAAAALVARRTRAGLAELVVADPYAALWALARAARARLAPSTPVFAVTGSSGKTTARAMLTAGLEALVAPVHASEGSLNNHLGVPLSLARTPSDAAAAVYEIGTNSHGEIAPLSELVRPTISVLLNVLPVHLEGLGDLAGVRREKLTITAGLDAAGTLVLHDAVAPPNGAAHAIVRFGRSQDADARLCDAVRGESGGEAMVEPEATCVHLPASGRLETPGLADGPHRRLTACAVLAAIDAAGLDVARAIEAVSAVEPPAGRGRTRMHGGVRVIDDAYNANPESMAQALRGLREHPGGPHVALLGDMLELGADSPALHASLSDACAGIDAVFLVGAEMRALYELLPESRRGGWWPDCAVLDHATVVAATPPGASLLVKGSNRGFWQHGTVAALSDALDARG